MLLRQKILNLLPTTVIFALSDFPNPSFNYRTDLLFFRSPFFACWYLSRKPIRPALLIPLIHRWIVSRCFPSLCAIRVFGIPCSYSSQQSTINVSFVMSIFYLDCRIFTETLRSSTRIVFVCLHSASKTAAELVRLAV